MAAVGLPTEVAGANVADHALAQKADGDRLAPGEVLLSEVQETSILRRGLPTPLLQVAQMVTAAAAPAPHRGLERSDFVLWNVTVRLPTRENAGYRQENGRECASNFTVRDADMTFARSSSGQNKLGSFVAMAPHFRFAAVISSPNS